MKGSFGDVRANESLLGDALRLGVAETRLLLIALSMDRLGGSG